MEDAPSSPLPGDASSSTASPVESLYELVRSVAPATAEAPPAVPLTVAAGIRALALRTPTLPPAAHTNVYLVGPPRGPIAVVDPGSPYPDQQDVLEAALADCEVALVVLTHHHVDHVGGAAALAARLGVPIAAHARTAQRLAGRVHVSRELVDREVIELGDVAITALYTPGHADGHLCFELRTPAGTPPPIIAGDMVAGLGTILIDPDEGDMARYLASLALLGARGPGALLPAHGPVIADGPGKLREYAAHRGMREARVLAALSAQPQTLAALCAVTYADTPKALWPLAERSLLAHLRKLHAEHRAQLHVDGRWSLPRVADQL